MPLHQWDYLFAFGTIFAALDAYNIGANDVANSFATSVASKSLTLKQACVAAGICEFLGAVLVGARVSGTIKNGIIDLAAFQDNAGVQLLGFTCAIMASGTWLMIATYNSWTVSTTYSIVASLIGVGVATGGGDAVQWGWNGGKGVATIFAGFLIAPSIAGCFGAAVYLISKYAVLVRKDSLRAGLYTIPFYFLAVGSILTMSIVYKGAPSLNIDEFTPGVTAGIILGTGGAVGLLASLFWLPFVYAKVVRDDYTLQWYHVFLGPLLWKRAPPADAGNREAVLTNTGEPTGTAAEDVEKGQITEEARSDEKASSMSTEATSPAQPHPAPLQEVDSHDIHGAWIMPKNLWIIVRYKALPWLKKILLHGSSVDIHALQAKEGSADAERIKAIHQRAKVYDNKTEHLFSFLQVMTACTASFAHGSNDVSNAIGPYSAIYEVWSTAQPVGPNTPIPVWMLAFGGAMIVIGLATYGYNIMRILGNRLTLMSPSRGFSMELGSSITVLLASQFGIPVSSTMCITGATIGVAMCNGDIHSFNWRGLAWILLGWVLTVPIASISAGCLMGIMLNAPSL
ncbi:sodium:inorganic phosphate symporter [Pterulicium gracile]|uniref:Phosphate transporter n=1 Tax=Pterulicium gracile TaxID=1884261 RepID=A0A5C3Q4X3_9AGAR|nr:sodium:inorganic phosphate symporter [Pterula gracilis]